MNFRRGLIGLVALGALSQFLIQSEAYSVNPMALVPQVDAATIWNHAGEIANGQLVDDAPYETAPLVLWVAGLLRALGGGLGAWGVLQSVLHVATVLLVCLVARALAASVLGRGGETASQPETVGLVAGALFLLLDEPAASTSRVLSGTLQLFLAALLLYQLRPRAESEDAPVAQPVRTGLLLGVLCLAYPPMQLGVVVLAAWAFFGAKGPLGLRSAAALVGATALAILPATVHNLKASGELIPISAQAGLTFYHGNNVEADGTIAPVGVVNSKDEQAADSLRQARAVLGDEAGWKDAGRYWRNKGLAWWGENPGAGVKLAATKLWYALSGRRYGDVYQPWRERDAGVASKLWLAPLPLAWLMPLALVTALGLLVQRARRSAALPLAVLVAVPIVTVVLFFYSPRYRLPSAAAVVPLSALALAVARGRATQGLGTSGGASPRWTVLLGAAALLGAAGGQINSALGIDGDKDGSHEVRFLERMAAASGQIDRHGDGARYLLRLVQLDPGNLETRGRLFDLAWLVAASPDDSVLEPAAALEVSEGLIEAFGPAPGLLDLRGVARAAGGDFAGALEDVNSALQGLPSNDSARAEMEQRKALFASGEAFVLPSPNS